MRIRLSRERNETRACTGAAPSSDLRAISSTSRPPLRRAKDDDLAASSEVSSKIVSVLCLRQSAHGSAPVGAPFAFATMRGRTSVLVEAAGQSAKDGRGMGISLAPPRRTGAPLHVPKLKSRRQTAPLFLYGPCYDPIEPDRGDIRRKSILGLHGIDFRDHFRIIGVPIIQGQDLQIRKLLL